MRPADFLSQFKEGILLPFYYFYGEEEYLKNKAISIVLERSEEKIKRGLNFEVFSFPSISIATLIDHSRTLPLFGRRKMVLLKEAEKIPTHEQEQLLSYLENPSKKTTLILVSSAVNFREKAYTPLLKSLMKYNKYGLVIELNHPFQREIPDWIKYMAKHLEKSIQHHAVLLLQELIGNNLQDLSNEMEKLTLFVGEKKEIAREDVEEVISSVREESVFELVDYIGNQKLYEALMALSQLLKSGEQPLKLLALIARQFRMIRKARLLLDQGMQPSEIGHFLKIKEFVWEKLNPQVNKFSEKKLMDCFQKMWEADVSLKTRSTPKKLVLEQLVLGLCE